MMGKILPAILIVFTLLIFSFMAVNFMGSIDSQTNLSDTEYEDDYNATSDLNQVTIPIIQILPLLGVVFLLIIVLLAMYAAVR